MTTLRAFRIDGKLDKAEVEFLIKVDGEEGQLLGAFDMTGDGIYFYRPGSQIMTPKENQKTRETYDGYLSFEVLKDIFQYLLEIGWDRDKHDVSVKKEAKKIVLEMYNVEE